MLKKNVEKFQGVINVVLAIAVGAAIAIGIFHGERKQVETVSEQNIKIPSFKFANMSPSLDILGLEEWFKFDYEKLTESEQQYIFSLVQEGRNNEIGTYLNQRYVENMTNTSASLIENKEIAKFAKTFAATSLSYATKVERNNGNATVTVVVLDKECQVVITDRSPNNKFLVDSLKCKRK